MGCSLAKSRLLSRTLGSSRRFNTLTDTAGDIAEFSQLLFTLLIPNADDWGRLAGDAYTVKLTVFPGSPRSVADFQDALRCLHESKLVTVYEADDDIWLQINKFEVHQSGLTKRTNSKISPPLQEIPGTSMKFPEIPELPASRARAELNRTEQNRTEQKGTEQKRRGAPPADLPSSADRADTSSGANGNGGGVHARSKHPVFKGQSLVVFDWMLDDLAMMLGPHTDGFHLDEWFHQLDAEAVSSNFIVPKRDKGQWLCEKTLAEARRRGLPMWDAKNTTGAERLTYRPFECPHTPQCTGRSACDVLQRLGR